MANPQVEDGYTKIANELMDALIKVPIGNADAQVMYAILRKTYGWSKKEDSISIGQLQEMTRLARRTVIYALKNLESKNMIVIKRISVEGINAPSKISFQKNYNKWVVQEKAISYKKTIEKQKLNYRARVVQEIEGSARNGKGVVQEMEKGGVFLAPTKETTTQKKITKERKTMPAFVLPDDIDPAVWDAFIEHRTKNQKKLTEYAKHLLVKKLESIGQDKNAVLNQSIEKGWAGLFPLKDEGGFNGNNSRGSEQKTVGQAEEPERRYPVDVRD